MLHNVLKVTKQRKHETSLA